MKIKLLLLIFVPLIITNNLLALTTLYSSLDSLSQQIINSMIENVGELTVMDFSWLDWEKKVIVDSLC